MKEKKLPKAVKQYLSERQINAEDVVIAVIADREEGHGASESMVVLTKEKLLLLRMKVKSDKVHQFGGYSAELTEGDGTGATLVKEVSVADIKKLETMRLINGGVLYVEKEEGEELFAGFSNSRMSDFSMLVHIFRKVSKNEELTEEDFKERKKRECCPKCGALYPDQERKICPRCMDKRSVFLRVMQYFMPYKGRLILMMLCYIGVAGINLAWPYLNGTILYDKVLAKNEAFLELLNLPAGKFGVLLGVVVLTMFFSKLMGQVLGIIQGVLTAQIVPEVGSKIKQDVFKSMGKLSISFYNSRQTGGLMTRVNSDASEVMSFFIDGLPYFLVNVLTIGFTAIVMFSLSPLLALVSLMLIPVLFFISYKMLPKLWSFYGRQHRASRSLNGQLNDNLTGARVVKAFGQEKKELKRFEKYNKRVKDTEMAVVGFDNRFYALYAAVENIASFAVWGVGAALVLGETHMELGLLITFSGYVSQLNGPLDFMSRCFRWYTRSINSAQRIFEILDAVPEVRESETPVTLGKMRGEIELKNVTFGYDATKPVLKDITFKVPAGEMLGIVGRSGAGKSTLVNLISRLYDPQEGSIYIDGVNVKDMSFAELRKNVAMVSQETYIFMGTVAENIAYARPDATREEIIAAAVQASAHDFICKMPDGYDTMVGSAGRSLSGGERQRISIARAILANPRILILDEATAAVDTETEQAIQHSLERLVKGRTTLSIAHRLSTLNAADKLIVIDNGKVTESGTHKELIEQQGTFYKLAQLQTKALAMRGLE